MILIKHYLPSGKLQSLRRNQQKQRTIYLNKSENIEMNWLL